MQTILNLLTIRGLLNSQLSIICRKSFVFPYQAFKVSYLNVHHVLNYSNASYDGKFRKELVQFKGGINCKLGTLFFFFFSPPNLSFKCPYVSSISC